ncbi:MAG: GNAT family N-acetyltransferase [Bacteriovoracaceae bacterium]|nr:GNAT family N-acetyltransferase [Bacteriovoracaceae bacterium]
MKDIILVATDSGHPDFRKLIHLLDKELKIRDGDDHEFYSQYNKLEDIKHTVVAYDDQTPIGCGAFKKYEEKIAEIKRMFVLENYRSLGVASKILQYLEKWAARSDFEFCILETGVKQPEAIRLYEKNGYDYIENFGQYAGVEASKCFKKKIQP